MPPARLAAFSRDGWPLSPFCAPPPHFHAVYGEYVALIAIDSLKIIEGDLPPRAQEMVIEWARQHQAELIQMWHEQSFRRLAPLE